MSTDCNLFKCKTKSRYYNSSGSFSESIDFGTQHTINPLRVTCKYVLVCHDNVLMIHEHELDQIVASYKDYINGPSDLDSEQTFAIFNLDMDIVHSSPNFSLKSDNNDMRQLLIQIKLLNRELYYTDDELSDLDVFFDQFKTKESIRDFLTAIFVDVDLTTLEKEWFRYLFN